MKKRILKTIIAILLLLSLIGSVCACGDDVEEFTGEYYNYGLHYKLPEEYRQLTVPYSEFCYYDGHAYFYFQVYSPEQLVEDLKYDADISVKSFSTKFMVQYDINLASDTYYEDIDRSVIIYDWEYDDTDDEEAELEDECFYHVIFRGSQLLYVVTMSCPVSMKDTYTPVFDEWSFSLHAD